MHHFRSKFIEYRRLIAKDTNKGGCPYCTDPTIKNRTVFDTETMALIKIRTKYDIFEGRPVKDHLMVVPKRHVESVADFTQQEMLDMLRIVGVYEKKGYNVYMRGVGSVSRSVAHQHTHLIKLKEKQTKFLFYLKKPYHLIQF